MTEDDIVKMARESGLSSPVMTADGNEVSMARMTRFAELVASAEREACAKAARDFITKGRSPHGDTVYRAIMARPNVKVRGCALLRSPA